MSTFTFSFFSFFASFTSSASSCTTGDPTNTTMRILWFLPWRCFSTRCAIRRPVIRLMLPSGLTRCSFDRMRPTSLVSVASTSVVLESVIRPTLFSGFERTFDRHTKLTPSFCAFSRVGK
uniref:Putative secreted peptide n=1 Tax=Anopheles braziliensis TaxID=58242 RepID=A0A2M3ZQ84_9DIPT